MKRVTFCHRIRTFKYFAIFEQFIGGVDDAKAK